MDKIRPKRSYSWSVGTFPEILLSKSHPPVEIFRSDLHSVFKPLLESALSNNFVDFLGILRDPYDKH